MPSPQHLLPRNIYFLPHIQGGRSTPLCLFLFGTSGIKAAQWERSYLIGAPILLYGCEVWGYENTDIIEKVHTKFCKFIFGVSKFSHNMPIYGELGRYPLSITIKQRMICYWTRILKSNQHKLNKVMYGILYNLHCKDTHSSGWIKCSNNIFHNNGMSYIWATQDFKVDSNNVHKC